MKCQWTCNNALQFSIEPAVLSLAHGILNRPTGRGEKDNDFNFKVVWRFNIVVSNTDVVSSVLFLYICQIQLCSL